MIPVGRQARRDSDGGWWCKRSGLLAVAKRLKHLARGGAQGSCHLFSQLHRDVFNVWGAFWDIFFF